MAPSGGGEQLKRHRRGLGPRRRQWLGGEAEVKEDLPRDGLLLDARDEPHRPSTTRAFVARDIAHAKIKERSIRASACRST